MRTPTDAELAATGIKPHVIEAVRACARRCGVDRVALYGSRARGDHRERSDIDLAFWGGDATGFRLDVDEEMPTLLRFDVTQMDCLRPSPFTEAVEKEGVVLYDRACEGDCVPRRA